MSIENNIMIKQLFSIDELFKLSLLSRYKKYFFMYKIDINLETLKLILPESTKFEFNNSIIEFENSLKNIDIEDYSKIFSKYHNNFVKLSSACIDTKVYNIVKLKEKNDTLQHVIKTFSYNTNTRQTRKVVYELNKTITGRLVVKQGSPSILTLPKKYRKIFQSRYLHEGELLMIDFKSLEPRIAKKLTSKETYKDIYEEINKLSEENLDRSVIKKAVISTLYGSRRSLDNISKEKTEKIMETCKKFFEYDKLIKISDNLCKEGYRKNFFGRPIHNKEETRPHVIVNNHIQSTAVDVALMYFCMLIDLVSNENCKPIFVIHDAIVFDTHNSYKNELVNIVNQGYNCDKLGYFPLELTNFMETTIE